MKLRTQVFRGLGLIESELRRTMGNSIGEDEIIITDISVDKYGDLKVKFVQNEKQKITLDLEIPINISKELNMISDRIKTRDKLLAEEAQRAVDSLSKTLKEQFDSLGLS